MGHPYAFSTRDPPLRSEGFQRTSVGSLGAAYEALADAVGKSRGAGVLCRPLGLQGRRADGRAPNQRSPSRASSSGWIARLHARVQPTTPAPTPSRGRRRSRPTSYLSGEARFVPLSTRPCPDAFVPVGADLAERRRPHARPSSTAILPRSSLVGSFREHLLRLLLNSDLHRRVTRTTDRVSENNRVRGEASALHLCALPARCRRHYRTTPTGRRNDEVLRSFARLHTKNVRVRWRDRPRTRPSCPAN